jgi:Flp pilus assembly pilin Flp
LTTIEYALMAGLVAATLMAAAVPAGQSLRATLDEVATALRSGGPGCQGLFCVEPAAGGRHADEATRRR